MLAYPDKQDIQRHMQGCDDNRYVNIYGDGSQTDPTNWWAALGGFGVWMPDWNNEDLIDQDKKRRLLRLVLRSDRPGHPLARN